MVLSKTLSLAICQMTSTDNWDSNIDWVMRKVSETSNQSSAIDIFCFPENALFMRLDRRDPMPSVTPEDPRFDGLSELAKQTGSVLYFGSVPLVLQGQRYNSALIFLPNGERLTPYQKIHLFDIQLHGQEAIRESDEFLPGVKPQIIELKGWKWGLSICYDLRFQELYGKYGREPVDIISVPSAFLVPTGQAHWHTLLRARAIESQCFVVAAAQGGSHQGKRETFGHSLVVDPWGQVLLDMYSGGVSVVQLDRALLEKVRTQIPMSAHRRLD